MNKKGVSPPKVAVSTSKAPVPAPKTLPKKGS